MVLTYHEETTFLIPLLTGINVGDARRVDQVSKFVVPDTPSSMTERCQSASCLHTDATP